MDMIETNIGAVCVYQEKADVFSDDNEPRDWVALVLHEESELSDAGINTWPVDQITIFNGRRLFGTKTAARGASRDEAIKNLGNPSKSAGIWIDADVIADEA